MPISSPKAAWIALFTAVLLNILSLNSPAKEVFQGDYYIYRGKPVALQRDTERVAVQYKPGAQRGVRESFRTPDGKQVSTDVIYDQPSRERAIHRVAPAAGRIAEAMAADQRVERTFPVYRNPKTNLMVFEFGEIIVRLRPESTRDDLARYCAANDLEIVEQNPYDPGTYLLKTGPKTASTLEAANTLAVSPISEWAEPNFGGQMFKFEINDPLYAQQWHLNNTGQGGGVQNADIDAPEAWQIAPGGANIVVAYIDDGCDIDHEDLAANIYHNPGETGQGRESNGIDDDQNGYVDDHTGWDFSDNDNNPRHAVASGSSEGHGTSTAGLGSAAGENSVGLTGVAFRSKILPVKIFKGDTYAGNYETAKAIRFASGQADILSNSWGGGSVSQEIESSLEYALIHGRSGKGCPLFFASGNNAQTEAEYPSRSVWAIAVGASTRNDARASYSSYGSRLTFLSPSGSFTTDRTGIGVGYDQGSPDTTGNYTGTFGGTSAATPVAAGIGALLLAYTPDLTPFEVQAILQSTADKINENVAKYDSCGFSREYGYGRVNARAALELLQPGNPVDDAFENNNTSATAYTLHDGFFSGLIARDDDWYALDAEAYQDLNIDAYIMEHLGDIRLELYSPSGQLAGSDTASPNYRQLEINTASEPGRWMLRVSKKSGESCGYHLLVTKRPPDDRFEPNDRLVTAKPIKPGAYEDLKGYDADYFSVPVGPKQRLTATIRFHNEIGDLDLYLYGTTGTLLNESATIDDTEAVSFYNDATATRTLILWIDNYEDCQNKYLLNVTVKPAVEDRFEENDTADAAPEITPGVYSDLQMFDEDWYRVKVGPRQVLEAEARFFNPVADIDVRLVDTLLRTLDESVEYANSELVRHVNNSGTTQTVLLSLATLSPDSIDYQIILTVKNVTDDRYEENDEIGAARTLRTRGYYDLVALDRDWFGLEARQGWTIAAILTNEPKLSPQKLSLFTPTGIPLTNINSGVLVSRNIPSTGTYKLSLEFTGTGTNLMNLYGMGLFAYKPASTATSDDRFEPNNSRTLNATRISPGAYSGLFCANDDYYRIQAQKGDTLFVAILFESRLADLDLNLYDSWGQPIRRSLRNGTSSEVCIVERVPETDDYFIGVNAFSGQVGYELLVGLHHPANAELMGVKRWNLY